MSQAVKLSHSAEVEGSQQLAEESAAWVLELKDAGLAERASFGTWATRSARHVDEYLLASAIDDALRRIGSSRIDEVIRRSRNRQAEDFPAADSIGDDTLNGRLKGRYRRPLLQLFLKRHLKPDAAEDFIHFAFRAAGDEIRKRTIKDEADVRVYLYRLACSLAVSYWHGAAFRSGEMGAKDEGAR